MAVIAQYPYLFYRGFCTARSKKYRRICYIQNIVCLQLTHWVALFYHVKALEWAESLRAILRATEGGVFLPCASSFRCSLINAALATSVSPILGGLLFLWWERKASSVRWSSRLLGWPLCASIAKIQGTTSSSFSKHHCKPWKSAGHNQPTKQKSLISSIETTLFPNNSFYN